MSLITDFLGIEDMGLNERECKLILEALTFYYDYLPPRLTDGSVSDRPLVVAELIRKVQRSIEQ